MKKFISLLAVFALLLALMAGCASKPAAEETPAEEPVVSEETTEPVAEESPATPDAEELAQQEEDHAAEMEAVDISSIELKLPLTEEPQTLTYTTKAVNLRPPLDTVGISSWADFEWVKQLEEMTGVHIEWQEISFMVYSEQFNLLMAGGDFGDYINACTSMYAGGGAKAVEDEIIIDLTPYLEEHAPFYSYYMNNVGNFKYDFALDDGSVVDFKSFYDEYKCNNGLVIRKDWLDKLGFDVPKTYDQMTEVLTAFKDEYGSDSTFYMHNGMNMEGFLGGFGVSSGATMFQVDGEVKCSVLEPGFRDYLALMQDWYNKGLINSDFISIEYDPFSPTINEGVGSDNIAVWPAMYEEVDKYATYNADPDFALAPVPNLVKAEGEIDHISARKMVDNDTVSISTKCENPELAVAWMDFWYSEAGYNMYNYGVEGKTFELVDGEPQFTDLIINNEFGLTVAAISRMWTPYGSLTGIYSPGRVEQFLSELQAECWNVWTKSSDGLYAIPTGIAYTALESEEKSSIETDIDTCVDENLVLFVTGAKPMEEWDAFIAQLETLQLDRLMEIYQDALDRYYAR
ncbi:MAG: extracellular solute-binding protein [Ruminococcaceae bacterium]|nr:extracellular solute-binding protein [Oscillospiraceae bacterium]